MGIVNYLSRILHRLANIFTQPLQFSRNISIMSSYSCTVSVEPGTTPEDPKSHHVNDKFGQLVEFKNPFPSFGRWKDIPFLRAGSIFLSYRLQGKLPVPDTSQASIPTVKPTFSQSRAGNSFRTTWLGHACCLIEFPSGFRAIFDPVFEERYSWIGPKRFTPAACKIGDLPNIDAVFISHNHPDHLSETSVKEILRMNPHVHFFVGLKVAKWFHDCGITAVTEMDWWDNGEIVLERIASPRDDLDNSSNISDKRSTASSPERISARISCLPSQHGSMRTLFDFNHSLWASWAVTSGAKSVWFAGDTGYRCVPEGMEELGPGFDELPRNPSFSEIGSLRGPFDLGLIPIGAYAPRFMYSPVHASPYDAVEIFQDTKCRNGLGIHWGTWALTSEAVDEPPKKLKEALKIKGLAEKGLFDVWAVGESREF